MTDFAGAGRGRGVLFVNSWLPMIFAGIVASDIGFRRSGTSR